MKIHLRRLDNAFHFQAVSENGNKVDMDAGTDLGGHNMGASPMQLLIMGLGGCSGIDIVLILQKQKQEISSFEITLNAEKESGKDFSLWKKVEILFLLEGTIDLQKAERAARLSMEKYCSVAKTLELSGTIIHHKVSVNGTITELQ